MSQESLPADVSMWDGRNTDEDGDKKIVQTKDRNVHKSQALYTFLHIFSSRYAQ